MVELVDTMVSSSVTARYIGSTPVKRSRKQAKDGTTTK